jgi:hypothetical protein
VRAFLGKILNISPKILRLDRADIFCAEALYQPPILFLDCPFDDSGMAFAAFAGFKQARVLGQAFDSEVAEGVFTVDLWL